MGERQVLACVKRGGHAGDAARSMEPLPRSNKLLIFAPILQKPFAS